MTNENENTIPVYLTLNEIELLDSLTIFADELEKALVQSITRKFNEATDGPHEELPISFRKVNDGKK